MLHSIILTATFLAAASGTATRDCVARLQREQALMGTTLRLAVCAQTQESAHAATEAAFGEVRRLNGVLSSWTDASEVGRLNRAAPGEAVAVSGELYGFLQEAGRWVAETDGAFDPAVGALVDAWGLRSGGKAVNAPALAAAHQKTGWRHLRLDPASVVTRGPAGWWLDTGGFGKGAALRSVADVLRKHGITRAEIDFGGQLMVFGGSVTIAVADPADRSVPVIGLELDRASAATSSQSVHANHVLDPRTGRPVPAWGSVTVVCADALAADALSTALFVMGPRAALEWARNRSDVGVLILENTSSKPRASWNDAMARMIIKE